MHLAGSEWDYGSLSCLANLQGCLLSLASGPKSLTSPCSCGHICFPLFVFTICSCLQKTLEDLAQWLN